MNTVWKSIYRKVFLADPLVLLFSLASGLTVFVVILLHTGPANIMLLVKPIAAILFFPILYFRIEVVIEKHLPFDSDRSALQATKLVAVYFFVASAYILSVLIFGASRENALLRLVFTLLCNIGVLGWLSRVQFSWVRKSASNVTTSGATSRAFRVVIFFLMTLTYLSIIYAFLNRDLSTATDEVRMITGVIWMFVLSSGLSYLILIARKIFDHQTLQQKVVSLKLAISRSSMASHFLLNSFNMLLELIDTRQNAKAAKFLEHLSHMYMYLQEYENADCVPLEKEYEFVKAYIEMNSVYQGVQVYHLNWQVPPEESQRYIVPASLQTLVENAVKHNYATLDSPLHINIYQESGFIVVANELRPKKAAFSTRKGLQNLIERYQILTNKPVRVNNSLNQQFVVQIPVL